MAELKNPSAKKRKVRHKEKYVEAQILAKQNPGKWVLLEGDYAPAVAYQINHMGANGFVPIDEWVATSRSIENTRRANIYVKYIGGDDGQA